MAKEAEIPDLLPIGVAPEVVLTPERILEHQAELLGVRSAGRLQGRLERTATKDGVSLAFMVEAPLLKYSHRLFRCWYRSGLPYPIAVFVPKGSIEQDLTAPDQDALVGVLKAVFGGEYVRSVVQSLLARTNEETARREAEEAIGVSQEVAEEGAAEEENSGCQEETA